MRSSFRFLRAPLAIGLLCGVATTFAAIVYSTDFTTLPTADWYKRLGQSTASIKIISDTPALDGKSVQLTLPGKSSVGSTLDGVSKGTEIGRNTLSGFGKYTTRVQFPVTKSTEEAVSGLFVYKEYGDLNGNGMSDLSEIDIEHLSGDPCILWLTSWTDYDYTTDKFLKKTRGLNMCTGDYVETTPGQEGQYGAGTSGKIAGFSVPNFPQAGTYYTLGFEWRPTFVRWFIVLNGQEVDLWKMDDAKFVPQNPAYMLMNIWHTPTHWWRGGNANYPSKNALLKIDKFTLEN